MWKCLRVAIVVMPPTNAAAAVVVVTAQSNVDFYRILYINLYNYIERFGARVFDLHMVQLHLHSGKRVHSAPIHANVLAVGNTQNKILQRWASFRYSLHFRNRIWKESTCFFFSSFELSFTQPIVPAGAKCNLIKFQMCKVLTMITSKLKMIRTSAPKWSIFFSYSRDDTTHKFHI